MPATLPPTNEIQRSAGLVELAALLGGAACAALPETGWLRVTGPDRVRWLNGVVTNSIAALKPGEGCYCFLLNAQGRIQGDLTAWMREDAILLETTQPAMVRAFLERYIIMDDVELADISGERRGLLVAGPQAEALLAHTMPGEPMRFRLETEHGRELMLIHAHSPLVPRFEMWSDAGVLDGFAPPVGTVSAGALEQLRMLEGTPKYGVDIRDRDLPQETGQVRALHFSKGCYLGQEIVERIRSRGQVHRMFSGFKLTGSPAVPGTVVESDGRGVGELTSASLVDHPAEGRIQLALGYVRREAAERGLPLTYAGGTASPIALPYTRT
ncbi:MAG: folate-binding protein [Acidobacteriota bacterium]|nr:folate-binding protein [Acidobacteriota bacterium]